MSLRISIFFLFVIFMVLASAGCSDDDPTSPPVDPDVLLTIHLDEYFLGAWSDEGLVFASGPDGKLLDMATWSGPAKIVLKNNDVHPDTISFTFVKHNDWELSFATELGVPAGTVRRFEGYTHSAHTGEANLTFLNAPYCERFHIANNWGSVSGPGPLDPNRVIQIYGDSTDCYVRIDPQDTTPIGGWLRGVKAGSSHTLDFDQPGAVAPLNASKVQFPSGGDRLSCNISGTVINGPVRSIIGFEWQTFEGDLPESVTFYTPDFDPSRMGSMFHFFTEGSPTAFFSQESTGPIPTKFTKLDGELTVTSSSPDSLVFTTTSVYDELTGYWSQSGNLWASWFFEGPASVKAFSLPQLPEYLTEMFPEYPRDGFRLRNLEIKQITSANMERSQGKIFSTVGEFSPLFPGDKFGP